MADKGPISMCCPPNVKHLGNTPQTIMQMYVKQHEVYLQTIFDQLCQGIAKAFEQDPSFLNGHISVCFELPYPTTSTRLPTSFERKLLSKWLAIDWKRVELTSHETGFDVHLSTKPEKYQPITPGLLVIPDFAKTPRFKFSPYAIHSKVYCANVDKAYTLFDQTMDKLASFDMNKGTMVVQLGNPLPLAPYTYTIAKTWLEHVGWTVQYTAHATNNEWVVSTNV